MIAPPKPPSSGDLEALIKEARARQLRRRLLAASGVAVAAAIGLSVYAVFIGPADKGASAGRGGPQATAAPCSAPGGWRLAFNGLWPEPTGQHTAALRVTRIGTKPCALDGYPAIALLNAAGQTLGFRYSHRGDVVLTSHSPRLVRVAGHRSAFFMLNKYRCDIRSSSVARSVRVRLPGVRGWLSLRLPHYPILDYCPAEAPSTTVDVSPLVARLIQASAQP